MTPEISNQICMQSFQHLYIIMLSVIIQQVCLTTDYRIYSVSATLVKNSFILSMGVTKIIS